VINSPTAIFCFFFHFFISKRSFFTARRYIYIYFNFLDHWLGCLYISLIVGNLTYNHFF
jgi:hypothetical protein